MGASVSGSRRVRVEIVSQPRGSGVDQRVPARNRRAAPRRTQMGGMRRLLLPSLLCGASFCGLLRQLGGRDVNLTLDVTGWWLPVGRQHLAEWNFEREVTLFLMIRTRCCGLWISFATLLFLLPRCRPYRNLCRPGHTRRCYAPRPYTPLPARGSQVAFAGCDAGLEEGLRNSDTTEKVY